MQSRVCSQSMSIDNLWLGPSAPTQHITVDVSLREIADRWADQSLRPTKWQRWMRWDPAKDPTEWLSSTLRGTATIQLFVRQVPNSDGGFDYELIDGQNRANSIWRFLRERSVKVRADCALRVTHRPETLMSIDDFSRAQQTCIEESTLSMCVYSPETTDDEIRRVYRTLNRGKMMTSHEVIRTWLHVPLVGALLNPIDEDMCARVKAIKPGWKPQWHRMMHTWVRIVAMVFHDGVYLGGGADTVERWVVAQETTTPSDLLIQRVRAVIEHTIRALERWHKTGIVFSKSTIPDVAWVFWSLEPPRAAVADAVHEAGRTIKGDSYEEQLWMRGGGSHEAVCERRAIISKRMQFILGLDQWPRDLIRQWGDDPPGHVQRAPDYTDEAAQAAQTLMDLQHPPLEPLQGEAANLLASILAEP